jgi:hypothetical protein
MLASPSLEEPLVTTVIDPWLNTAQLCRALSDHFGGRKIHRDTVRKALKMGLPYQVNRLNGRKEFLLSTALDWWIKPPLTKAS